jgi:hypothetical protein
MRQARALGCEHAVLQSPNLVLPATPLQHQYQRVLAVQTVGAPAQTSLAADMKLSITGTREDLTDSQLRWLRCGMALCTFLMVAGAALIIGSLLVLGPGRFQVTSDGGITGTCASVFDGPHGDMGNADDGAQARQMAELRGHYDNGPSFDRLCNDERSSRRMWMWGLVGLGWALSTTMSATDLGRVKLVRPKWGRTPKSVTEQGFSPADGRRP